MISLRNIPFFVIGILILVISALAFKEDCLVWSIFALIYFVLGFAFRKQVDTADGGH